MSWASGNAQYIVGEEEAIHFFWSYDGWYFLSPAVSLESQDTVIWTAMDMKYCGYF